MKLPGYPEYIASRDAWVGSVPAHWTFLRADFTTASNKEQISDTAMEGIEILHYSIPNVQESGTAQIEDGNDIDSSKLLITKRQLLISKLNPRKATICIAEPDEKLLTVCSGEFVPIIPEGNLTLRYCYYTWLSDKVTKLLSSRVQSVTRSHQRVSPEDITKMPWAWPPAEEQQKIAAFLDWKTGQIDALIARKKELLEKLKEKRIGVITQAVTKGLNPDSPMRDSCVPWLGQVPQHWEVKKLSRVTASRCDGPFGSGLKSEHYSDEGVRVVRLQNIEFGEFDDEDKAYIDPEYYNNELGDHDVLPGDLLVAGLGDTNNPVGRACRAPDNIGPAMVKADCFRYRLEHDKADPQFTAYQMSVTAMALSGALASGVTRPRMNLSLTSARIFAFPPIDEQVLLVSYLDAESRKFQEMFAKVNEAIIRLTEYRTALITAATTGKIDVRQVKIPLTGA